MAGTRRPLAPVSFTFDCYRFNGKGIRPSVVASPNEANFMRSRASIEESLLGVVRERAHAWGREYGLTVTPKEPYPSSEKGKYWVEFTLGGITL